ncbi:uncharacterized protein N7511_001201 [Penicillium nucicola]|uniref:uncharacterized protein n=1 Tax=Penicillium nucicola TaxID=1850975 RepID=UPI00254559C5|nr:uncharacterized protein N7511_001201 [Penicillium nucicola]KAJ5776190.1 hypothetical protein N7511_001201 [Penicillium nucicola]
MSVFKELSSWSSPSYIQTSPTPSVGNKAPSCSRLLLPADNGKPTVISFLRHCGCPVAEATFITMRDAATQYPNIDFIAVSHSDQASTEKWLEALGGPGNPSSGSVTVIVDAEREIYAKWGLGVVSWSHLFNPAALWGVLKIGKEKGIWNRPTESGSRWQCSGHWAVDGEGVVLWGGPAARADETIDIKKAVDALQ